MPFYPFRGGCNGFGLSLLLGGVRGKEALTVPPSGSPDSYDPKAFWSVVTNGGERGGVMVANYVAAFVPHSVSVLHSLFHGHRRHRVGEEAKGNILWAKFAHRWPQRSPWAPSPAPLGRGLLDDAPCRRGGRGASSLVRPNQGVGPPRRPSAPSSSQVLAGSPVVSWQYALPLLPLQGSLKLGWRETARR